MSIVDANKPRRGRPHADTVAVNVRLRRDSIRDLEKWAAAQPDQPGRAEAIRRILADFLKSSA